MLSVSSLANATPVINTPQSAAAVAVSDRASIRLTPAALSAPLRDERVTDNNNPERNTALLALANKEAQSRENNSAAYVAQLLAQEEAPTQTTSPYKKQTRKIKNTSSGEADSEETSLQNTENHYHAYSATQSRNHAQLKDMHAPQPTAQSTQPKLA